MLSTGNHIVDQLGQMRITGNVIPAQWYKTITRANGKPYLTAIVILADIVYWYRPTEIRDEATGQLIGYRKRFKADKLQRSYAQLSEQFGISKKEATSAITHLESLGIVERDFRTVEIAGIKMNNVLFIGLNPEALAAVTYEVDPYHSKRIEGVYTGEEYPLPTKGDRVSPQEVIGLSPKVVTNTEITQETTTRDYNEEHTHSQEGVSAAIANHEATKEYINETFELAWSHYPKKEGKQKARRAFEKAVRGMGERKSDGTPWTPEEIITETALYGAHIEQRLADGDITYRFVPTGGTWFDGEGWTNDIPSGSSRLDYDEARNRNLTIAKARRMARTAANQPEPARRSLVSSLNAMLNAL